MIIRLYLIAFSTAKNVTPTSANTAIHMVPSPNVASTNTATFTPMANHTFCWAMRSVLRAMRMAVAIFAYYRPSKPHQQPQ